ncbi:E3 ubiquitin-protein ligase LRSAM1-like [Ornithodoros turicata]|uniref:E3 ubiquitin-protein ligase LRSAM1-like n=1 Tax=Ornithodoros turicata TaxID=34597 RepID=UPI0031398815
MPLFKNRGNETERRKLEQKLYLAQENPDEVFDLSVCALKRVPSGVFAKCRVFRKTALILHSNRISSLDGGGSLKDLAEVEVLDLHSNDLRVLPEDIGVLKCLKVLDVSSNALKTIPDSFESLTRLEVLNVSANKFNEFPRAILELKKLQQLDISNNEIQKLPAQFYRLSRLKSLHLDSDKFIFPNVAVCNGGIETIMRFLCDHCGVEYPVRDEDTHEQDTSLTGEAQADTSGQHFEQLQNKKEQRRLDMLATESQLREAHVADAHLAEDAMEKRQQLLLQLAREQDELHAAVLEIQNQRDVERKKLLSDLERHAAALVQEISRSVSSETSERLREALEVERLDMEHLYSTKHAEMDATKKQAILNSMADTLCHSDLQIIQVEQRKQLLGRLQESDLATARFFEDTIAAREKVQQDLTQHIQMVETYQKNAFEALQLKNDKVHHRIIQQIHLVEKELSKLTEVERKRRDLKVTNELDALATHRTELAFLLALLLDNKAAREKELREYIREVEARRDAEMGDFWLVQYQRLLDRKPPGIKALEEQLDQRIVSALMNSNAEHYITLFAAQHISWDEFVSMGRDDFKRLGILSEDTASALEVAVTRAPVCPAGTGTEVPSAPLSETAETPEQAKWPLPLEVKLWCSSECVICLDVKTLLVFLPCGHVCCCQGCGEGVLQCPLCRAVVENKLSLI